MKKVLLFTFLILTLFGSVNESNATNLISNGDFELGNTGFGSDYTFKTISQYPLGYYNVATNPNSMNLYWSSYGDHTSGNGNMMIVDGSDVPNNNLSFWRQSIPVTQNTDYTLSFWFANNYPSSTAIIDILINGSSLGNANDSSVATWINFSSQWNSGNATIAQISLLDRETAGGGNDFSIDDVSFTSSPVPEPSTLMLGLLGLAGALGFKRKK